MLSTIGVVQPRSDTSTWPGKLNRKLGGKSLLEWVVRRVTDSQRLEGVIVVVCDTQEHLRIAELVPADVPVYVGRERDPLTCLIKALNEFPAESVVRVHADNPFVDPVLIDRLVTTAESHPTSDYISYCSRDGRPTVLSPLGIFGEWFRVKALKRTGREAVAAADREQVTRYIYSHPEIFNLRLIPAPPELDRDDVRLTIDSEEDWENTQTIYEALGPEHLDWQQIAGLLDQQPALRERMAVLNRAGSEY